MLASELVKLLSDLIESNGDRPIFLSEEGNEYEAATIEVVLARSSTFVEKGTTYYYIS